MEVSNMHVQFLCNKLALFAKEIIESQSAVANFFGKADKRRLESYLKAIDTAHDWIKSAPELDLPKTTPTMMAVEPFPEMINLANDAARMLRRLLLAAYTELANSQSSRLGAGLIEHDSERLTDMVTHCRDFLTKYINETQPLDQPEMAPMTGSAGQGNAATA